MTVSAANGISSSDIAPRDVGRRDDERAGDFAAMFAGATQPKEPKPEPKKAAEGTSELDKPEESEKSEERAGEVGRKKIKRARIRATLAPNTSEVVQSTSTLDPELQSKLARVIARMQQETGHDVTVAETYRSQERQDTLFAQGRDTAGPVVTWTRNSKHTQGRAVDVVLDGSDAGLDAYTTLQRIANEEGLRTLGARDPGHLELPGSGQPLNVNAKTNAVAANDVIPNMPVEPADASRPGQVSIARIAQVAQVAQITVEGPAEVARVATVARPEIPGATSRTAPVTTVSSQNVIAATETRGAQQSMSDSTDKNSGGERNSQGEHRGGGYSALAAAVAMRDLPSSQGFPVESLTNSAALNPAERTAQIIAAYQDAPARPLSQITMNIDAGNGVTDKVQVSMRGGSLNAAIEAGDTRGAQAMTQRADELVRALSRDGIEVESLRVRAAAGTTTAAAVTGSQQSQSSSDASTHSKFERNPWQQQDRQRSQEERRQQQRGQRGGQDQ